MSTPAAAPEAREIKSGWPTDDEIRAAHLCPNRHKYVADVPCDECWTCKARCAAFIAKDDAVRAYYAAPARPAPQGAPDLDALIANLRTVPHGVFSRGHDNGEKLPVGEWCRDAVTALATLRAQAVAGAEDTARLVKENTRLREPDTYWLADDPETGNNDVEDFRDVIEVGEVARLIVGHTLPPQWAAHVRIPETPTSDADSEVQLFATAAEAHAALATPERAP